MNIGFDTIGNATILCYDSKPVLVTDPWITGSAYFNSWTFSHVIPEAQRQAIQSAEYIWLSHGHPDHLSSASLKLLRDKKILLPNHVGSRIYDGLKVQGYDVHLLKDRVWTKLSDHIRILTIADYNQDAILLIDINGRLLVNLNDASDRGWGHFVKKTVANYPLSFLLCLSGFNDADMINFFDESGQRVLPPLTAKKTPFGGAIARKAEWFGVNYFIPSSSMHRYQRKDSLWANEYTTALSDYAVGFQSKTCEILPAYTRYDCERDAASQIKPVERTITVIDPEQSGDSWNEPLEAADIPLLEKYFQSIEHLKSVLSFVTIRVSGKDHEIKLGPAHLKKGIVFEVPRNSLMTAVQFEIFDDLLIGNFMKTTLLGKWDRKRLYPDFTPYVAKYADNGQAKTKHDLEAYFVQYRQRALFDHVRHQIQSKSHSMFWSLFPVDTLRYQTAKAAYHRFKTILR